jgi:ABC-type branched-subunit amino acid transport system substrate-binding protein
VNKINRNRNSKRTSYVVLTIFFTLLYFGQNVMAKPFTVAAIYPPNKKYSIPLYVVDEVIKNAQANGQNIKLINLINTDGSFSKAILLAKQAEQLHVDAVIGGCNNSEHGLAVSKILNDAQIPLIVTFCSNPGIFKDRPYVFSVMATSDQLTKNAVFKRMVEIVPHPKKILIIRNLSMQYSVSTAENIAQSFHKKYPNIEVYYSDIVTGYECVECMVDQLQKIKPDILYTAAYSSDISSLLIGLTKAPFPVHIFIGGASFTTEEIAYYKLILKNNPTIKFYVFSPWSRKLSGKYASEFRNIVIKSPYYDKNILTDWYTVLAFDTARFLVDIINMYPSARKLDLVKSAKTIHFNGISGKFWFDKNGNAIRDYNEMSFIN